MTFKLIRTVCTVQNSAKYIVFFFVSSVTCEDFIYIICDSLTDYNPFKLIRVSLAYALIIKFPKWSEKYIFTFYNNKKCMRKE